MYCDGVECGLLKCIKTKHRRKICIHTLTTSIPLKKNEGKNGWKLLPETPLFIRMVFWTEKMNDSSGVFGSISISIFINWMKSPHIFVFCVIQYIDVHRLHTFTKHSPFFSVLFWLLLFLIVAKMLPNGILYVCVCCCIDWSLWSNRYV